jgi:hypothetical protein
MSLPSYATFYYKGEEVKKLFVNCGWICNRETIERSINRALQDYYMNKDNEVVEWDEVKAYGETLTKA